VLTVLLTLVSALMIRRVSIEARLWVIAWALMTGNVILCFWIAVYWRSVAENCRVATNKRLQLAQSQPLRSQESKDAYFPCVGARKIDWQLRLSFDVFHLRYGLCSVNGDQPPFPLFHSNPLAEGGCVHAQAFALIHQGLDDKSCRETVAVSHPKYHTQSAATPFDWCWACLVLVILTRRTLPSECH
jgi:hypothetical protein